MTYDTRHLATRRAFLRRGTTLLTIGATAPALLDRTALALNDPFDLPNVAKPSGKDDTILVVVQLSGGNDGLNTVIPFADDDYHRVRPGLAKSASDVFRLNDAVGLNNNLQPLQRLYDEGWMNVVQGVGYPNPNRSHFRSMDIWHAAEPAEARVTSGWLGRYFDATCGGADPKGVDASHPASSTGLAIGGRAPLLMSGERVSAVSFERPEEFRYVGKHPDSHASLNRPDARASGTTRPVTRRSLLRGTQDEALTPASQLDYLTRTAMDARAHSDRILKAVRGHEPPREYPNGSYGQGLRSIAAMIGAGLPTRVYFVDLGGFDTHANQSGRHDRLMRQWAEGVGAFWADMKRQGNADRVVMMTFSEFGRRVAQNASGGTDHGAAAPMYLFGPSVRPGLWGTHPSLTDLDDGDLKYTVDFRHVYAALLRDWLDADPKAVLGGSFRPADVLRG